MSDLAAASFPALTQFIPTALTQFIPTAVGPFAGSPALDLVYLPNGEATALGLFVGDGAGHFTASQLSLGGSLGIPRSLAGGDFNEDGIPGLRRSPGPPHDRWQQPGPGA